MTVNFADKRTSLPILLAASVLLGACSSNDDSDAEDAGEPIAFAATAVYPTGEIVQISDQYTVSGSYPATTSDLRVETDGTNLFQLGRLDLNSLTKFDKNDTSAVGFQYSVNGEETNVNPHDVVFASETKAYVLRYESPTIWIVNPSATSEEEFKIGELDISAYDPDTADEDTSPKATSGVIVDGKLYVLIQRLTGFSPIEQGYVAVFDVETDSEINTEQGAADNVNGIPLGSLNPTNIRYNAATDEIYVTGRGNIFVQYNMLPGDPYSGGLFAIDNATYTVSQYLDDGDAATNNGMGFIERTLVVGDEKGYVSLYAAEEPAAGVNRSVLHTFNLATGVIGEPVAALDGKTVASLTMGNDGYVWVGVSNADAPGFVRLNPQDDTAVGSFIPTALSPLNLVFID